ncbi:MAG: hypothetical protein A2W90_02470 [Bacteroidetes bacterium GWF2_42_66]|nr:MAG: hypothetical protein A2W92_16240 [Bacteroidetes bacterium GWA2_42_15]OFY01215.1 MAG: hypothetical protein A2W89_15955 [Bacteroidetes bacterium GWE2_42_39]OFY42058.1 MAG: hypothetical protein A2W90_02470 [Bacteroidetes bacterium GWF2_42_66]HBL77739.1 hypothetical protein [Prolixibacteraceae bacterium]HCB62868.1 hypothetical protein [Bacteroidales bacterium]
MKQQIETRKNEVRFATTLVEEMYGKYLAEDLKRSWKDKFIDEDTKEITAIDRFEMIAPRGSLIDQNLIAKIRFHIETEDISEIWVSNQCRAAKIMNMTGLHPWSITAKVGKKKHKILLYANSVDMATEVAKDYIELNFRESFFIENVRNFDNCIIINEPTPDDASESENAIDKKFYKIEVNVQRDSGSYTQLFVVFASTVNDAMNSINGWLAATFQRRASDMNEPHSFDFTTTIETAVVLQYSCSIEREFSLAYINSDDND